MLGTRRYPGRFNLFQRTMMRWRGLHPYNAVHVMTIAAELDRDRLAQCVNGTLGQMGLNALHLNRSRRRFRYGTVAQPLAVEFHPAGADACATVRAEMEAQLNRPFPDTSTQIPFRCFAVVEGHCFHVGLAYDHFVCGGDSIVGVLQAVFAAYDGHTKAARASAPPLLYPQTYRSILARRPRETMRGMANMPDALLRARRSARPRYSDVTDARNAFLLAHIDPQTFRALLRTSKSWGVTVNDFFLAALLHAMAPLADLRRTENPGLPIGVASIANIRSEFELPDARAFGQFLASFRVGHAVPPGISMQELAQDVQRETAAIKRDKVYLRIIFALAFAGLNWPFLSQRRRHRFFPRTYPVWGGVTMLNVDALWPPVGAIPGDIGPGVARADDTPMRGTPTIDARGRAADYVRGVSTGPLTPFVLAISTCCAGAALGVSYRPSVFAPDVAAGVLARIVDAIDQATVGIRP